MLVGTRHVVSLPNNTDNIAHKTNSPENTYKQNQFSKPIPGSLSVIIQQYKSSVKRWYNKNKHNNFIWQSRFYERIIRNAKAYQTISDYIIRNPLKWKEDRFFLE